jgi:hypothetical protein
MRPLHGLLPLGLAAALPAGAQVSAAAGPQQRADTLTVTVSPPAGASTVRFYIERTAGSVTVVAPEMALPTSSRSVRGLLQARGPVRLLIAPGAVGLRLRSVDPSEDLRVERQTRDSLGTATFTAEGRSITFVRGEAEPGLRVLADRIQMHRSP